MSKMDEILFGRLVVGIEDDNTPGEDPAVRLYLDHRTYNRYVLVSPEDGESARQQWSTVHHMFIRVPDDAPIYEDVKP